MKPDANAAPAVRRSLVLSFSEKYLRIFFQLVAASVLARLLTPHEYGVYTIGLVLVYIVDTFRDFGMVTFLVQEKHLTRALIRTAYGVSLLISCCLGAGVVLLSGTLAKFYHSPGVRDVLLVLSLMFLMLPFTSVVAAILRRNMRFGTLLRINAAASFANNFTAIVLAALGFGFMSLAWGQITGSTVNFILSSFARPSDMSHLPSFAQWRRVTSFGIVAVGATLVSDLGNRAPDLLIGRFLGITAVGLFGRGVSVIRLFDMAVTRGFAPVAVSSFAMRYRTGDRLSNEFLSGLAMVTSLAWPFFAFMGLMAYPMTHILFGPQWDAAVPVTRLLCFAGGLTASTSLNGLSLQATGAVNRMFVSQWIIQSASIGLVLLACQYSLPAIGYAMVAAALVNVIVSFRVAMPVLHVSAGQIVHSTAKSLAVTAGTCIAPLLVTALMRIDASHIWLPFVIAGAGAAIGFTASARGVRHPLWREIVGALQWARRGYGRLTAGGAV